MILRKADLAKIETRFRVEALTEGDVLYSIITPHAWEIRLPHAL
jgi:hypothetical protein